MFIHLEQTDLTAEPERFLLKGDYLKAQTVPLFKAIVADLLYVPHWNQVHPEIISPQCHVPTCALSDFEPLS